MYLAARAWGISPSEFWGMTTSEILAEYQARGQDGNTYAGGMTASDIEEISAESKALREKVRARRHGTATA